MSHGSAAGREVREVNLKGRAQEWSFVSHVLEELIWVSGSTANQVHCEAICRAKLDVFATAIEAAAEGV